MQGGQIRTAVGRGKAREGIVEELGMESNSERHVSGSTEGEKII